MFEPCFSHQKTVQATREMKRYNLDFLGVSETHWTGSGRSRANDGTVILHSQHQDRHMHGVALLIAKEKANTLMEWEPISDRFNSKYSKLTILQCYAPTNDADEEQKDEWYKQLQSTISKLPQHDVLLVIDDFNA